MEHFRSTLLHLRFVHSIFLAPVFFFAVSVVRDPSVFDTVVLFILLHLFLYPASQAFNSYYDKDTESIGGLKHPPEVSRPLLYWALIFDGIALSGFVIYGIWPLSLALIYGLFSKAYSHPLTRWKARPFLSSVIVAACQGALIFYLTVLSLQPAADLTGLIFPALLSSLMILASYPLTQVYQHRADQERGDLTLSRWLGVRGTFIFSLLGFALVYAGFFIYFAGLDRLWVFWMMQAILLPSTIFMLWWTVKTWLDPQNANFENSHRLTQLSSVSAIVFFVWLALF